jgi:OmpA-OmpF porin, OOP family
LFLVPIQKGETVRINNIFFEFREYQLLPESFSELNRIVNLINENPTMQIQINGYTDNVGGSSANLSLSKQRANAVAEYLTEKGISKSRLKIKGYGAKKPLESNETEEGRSRNRRVEFEIIEK